jgi:ferredoxin-thioredoxin reductase catalytic subunit
MREKRDEFKELQKRCKSHEQSLEEQKTTHEELFCTHERIKEAHSTLLAHKDAPIGKARVLE